MALGVNCMYDIQTCLETMKMMKEGLQNANLDAYLMCQPLGFLCPEVRNDPEGYYALPEAPLCKRNNWTIYLFYYKFMFGGN